VSHLFTDTDKSNSKILVSFAPLLLTSPSISLPLQSIHTRDLRMKNITPILVFTIALLTGCASAGNQFDINAAESLIPGKTTYAEAVQILGGEPIASKVEDDGTKKYGWSRATATPVGATLTKLTLLFDSNGVFIREVARQSL